MNTEGGSHVVQWANDIARFFESEPDHAVAVDGVAGHIRRYWEPRMRRKICAHLREGGDDLSPLARDAVMRLADEDRSAA